jgi:hypothetical protein
LPASRFALIRSLISVLGSGLALSIRAGQNPVKVGSVYLDFIGHRSILVPS